MQHVSTIACRLDDTDEQTVSNSEDFAFERMSRHAVALHLAQTRRRWRNRYLALASTLLAIVVIEGCGVGL